jgi:hypothetical protein
LTRRKHVNRPPPGSECRVNRHIDGQRVIRWRSDDECRVCGVPARSPPNPSTDRAFHDLKATGIQHRPYSPSGASTNWVITRFATSRSPLSLTRTSTTWVERPAWRCSAVAISSSPGPAAPEHVELHLDGSEVVTRREVAERLPRADGVGERHPGATVDEAARMQVPAIYDHAAPEVFVGDLDRLDAEVAREAVRDSHADRLHGDAGIRLGHQPLKVEGPKSPNGSSRSRTACLNPSFAARRWNA